MVLRKILGAICPILIVPNIRLEILDPVSGMTEIFKNIRFFIDGGPTRTSEFDRHFRYRTIESSERMQRD
jgi:hypothetical protein